MPEGREDISLTTSRFSAEPGSHAIAARAISGDGTTQTAVRAQPFPDGASGIQSLMVTVE